MSKMDFLTLGRWGSLLLSFLLSSAAQGQKGGATSEDPYAAALTLASRAETPPEMDAAARALFEILPRYPQDVDIPLQLGWLKFRLGRFADAIDFYRIALSRGAGGNDAELGIAWSLLKLGECGEAREHFQTALIEKSTPPDVVSALEQCGKPVVSAPPVSRLWVQPSVAQAVYLYKNHPFLKYTVAPLVRLDALLYGRFYAGVAYRYSYFATQGGQVAPWSQHDVFVDIGVTSRRAGATLHYALLADKSGYSGNSNHVGLTARYSFAWDAFLNLSASFFQDAPVLRGELAFRVPIYAGLNMRPSMALQWTPGEVFKTAGLTAMYDHRRFSLWLGGKVGDEKRAAYLNVAYVYNGPTRTPYGAWAGVLVRPGASFALSLAYTYDRMIRTDTTPVQDSTVHSLTLGISREF